jgi:hypothetical protein
VISLSGQNNFFLGRVTYGDDRISFAACFDLEVTYVHCNVINSNEKRYEAYVIFSTVSKVMFWYDKELNIYPNLQFQPFRTPINSNASTSLAYQHGISSSMFVLFGETRVC